MDTPPPTVKHEGPIGMITLLALATAALPGTGIMPRKSAMPGAQMVYAARGQAPAWTLTVTPGRGMTDRAVLDIWGADRRIVDLARVVTLSPGGTRRWQSVSQQMSVLVAPLACRDSLSGERFSDTVTVRHAGQVLRGCGGAKAAVNTATLRLIEDIEWIVEDIDGARPIDGSRVTIAFRDGRVSGSSGCNSFSGLADIDEWRIRFGPSISTQMGCAPAQMRQESRFIGLLQPMIRWRVEPAGALVLETSDGRRIKARRKA